MGKTVFLKWSHLQYVNKLYFDGELDFKTKAGLKEGMSKGKSNMADGTEEEQVKEK